MRGGCAGCLDIDSLWRVPHQHRPAAREVRNGRGGLVSADGLSGGFTCGLLDLQL